MNYKKITYDTHGRRVNIMLNRPDKRNALNGEVVAELIDAFDRAEEDQQVKVIVLGGNGKVFCAGADLAYLQELQKNSFEENLEDSRQLKLLFSRIYKHSKIVIARVHGHAIAGGCGLATVCDFIFSVPEAKFGYTEVRIGFVPALVKIFLLRKLGESRARQLLLTGELIDAVEAKNIGLVYTLSDPESLDASIEAFSEMIIKKNSSRSMALTKEMIAAIPSMSLDEALEYAARMNAKARETDDCKKGIAAFLNKTKPEW